MEEHQVTQRSRSKKGSRLALRNLVLACWSPPTSECNEEHKAAAEQCLVSRVPDDVLVECLARIPRSSLPDSMMVCRKWRHILKSDDYYHVRRKLGRVESLVLVFGGVGAGLSSATYCESSGVWQPGYMGSHRALAENEWLLDYHRADHALVHTQPAVVKHRIFILGASSSSSKSVQDCTIVYDTWTKSLTRAAPMLCPRKKFVCCVISNRILVAGGASRIKNSGSSRDAIMDAEEYIPELNLWRPIASMPRKRYGCLGAAVDGIFYVIGGIKFSTKQPYAYVGSMDSFDPRSNSWQKAKPLPMGGCVIACTVVGPCIYMLSSHAVELSFWKYDTRSDSWTKIKPPPIPSPLRIDSFLKFSCVTIGSSVHIIQVGGSIDDLLRRSGRNGRGLREGLVLVYDTHLQEWSRGPDLPYVKNGAVCTVVEC